MELEPRSEVIVDHPKRLEHLLRTADQRGRLLTDPADIRPRRLADGRYQIRVTMLLPVAPTTRFDRAAAAFGRAQAARRRFERENPVLTAVAKALAFVGALFAGFMLLIATFFAWLRSADVGGFGPAVLVLAAALLLAWAALIRRTARQKQGYGFHWSKCDDHRH